MSAGGVAAPGDDDFQLVGKGGGSGGNHDVIDQIVQSLKGALHRGGVDGCAFDFHGLVLAAKDGSNAPSPNSAGAALAGQEGHVAGGESNQGHGLDADGGGDELAFPAVGNGAAGIVENLDVQQLGMEMTALAGRAFAQR